MVTGPLVSCNEEEVACRAPAENAEPWAPWIERWCDYRDLFNGRVLSQWEPALFLHREGRYLSVAAGAHRDVVTVDLEDCTCGGPGGLPHLEPGRVLLER